MTGGHAGIGLETTRALSGAGATAIVGARTLDKAHAAVACIARVEIDALDLFDPASIDALPAARVRARRDAFAPSNPGEAPARGVRATAPIRGCPPLLEPRVPTHADVREASNLFATQSRRATARSIGKSNVRGANARSAGAKELGEFGAR